MKKLEFDLTLPQIVPFIEDKNDTIAEGEIKRGFSWRPTMLTYFILEECDSTARVEAEFRLEDQAVPSPEAERVIQVPFAIGGARFTFVPGTCEAAILRGDPDLRPPPKSIMGKA